MTQVIGTGKSAVQSIQVWRDRPTKPLIDVDARKALQVRWTYQAGLLERAILDGNEAAQDRIMETLLMIEHEAIRNGVLEDLDSGDGSLALEPVIEVMKSRQAVGRGCAERQGGYERLTALVWIPKSQQRGDGSELADELFPRTRSAELAMAPYRPLKREKIRVDLGLGFELEPEPSSPESVVKEDEGMALGVKKVEGGVPVGAAFEAPASQIGKTAGQSLSKPPGLTVSKAEQLKAMKKARAGADKAEVAKTGVQPKALRDGGQPKKPKVQTLCLDGCGQMCGGRFAIGHDAKLKSVLTKIERGELDISAVPEIAKPFVKFSKPVIVPSEADPKVKTTTYQLLMAPVRFFGREDVQYVQDLGEAFGNK